MRNVIIQLHAGENPDFAASMAGIGFEPVVLHASGSRFMPKPALFLQYLNGTARLLLASRKLRAVDTIIVSGHFACAVKFLARLRILKYRRLLCFAFFVHSRRLFPFVRLLSHLDRANDHYVIFSRSEVDLYAERLGIERSRMHYLPYGEWAKIATVPGALAAGDAGGYYFAGGYSNRDYRALVEVFRKIPARLVIICSRLNRDLDGVALPPNVSVLYDVPRPAFEAYAEGAKAGIVWLKHDTGASGQSVVLILMRHGKCVIASNAGAIRDYIQPGVSGYLLNDLAAELPQVIASIEQDCGTAEALGKAARDRYEAYFSPAAVAQAFEDLLRAA
jgi:glycosyltransferase involved in cell wall biosynthesis